ncbi:hypothetical protein [Streptomyces liangshanensis]|uniref:SseB family protein n=1 Tax=Streptomyces liangshanensis TaxID=2717324 RepID=A0A6G9GZE7_9ACTN|nr:hypothetical protein [Streptomyces liangshanensis]QIQ03615.1 hypothetical protein HA039_15900 [Streptomyces liangshanensis]
MGDGTALEERIAERRAGVGDPRALVGELRRALVLVPYDRGGLWTARFGGVRWVCGFTDEAALARFARARDAEDGREAARGPDPANRREGDGEAARGPDPANSQEAGPVWEFAALRGARLLDEIVPAMGEPAGVAVNIGDVDGAMLFPPVVGIVPEAVAVDAGEARDGERG